LLLRAALGGLLNGPAQRGAQQQNDASFGELFNDALARQDEPEVTPTAEQNAIAGLMLRAMIQAAKADGKIDEAERERLLGQMGDLDDEDRAFIREQMAAPVDAQALAREVPKGLEPQVYMMSLMAIDFDNRTEAEYLNSLAQAMGIDRQVINQIHQHVGVQDLYS
ncbi:tellurite resistance TerB family protein, partial [Paracoccus sanguinis]|uniref:tellurite resistance TerB family protein n=1 Tax=Paracoccus sanguinis TaxID=1545044 RepID=UPI00051FE5C4